jgi:hypothetical protein
MMQVRSFDQGVVVGLIDCEDRHGLGVLNNLK